MDLGEPSIPEWGDDWDIIQYPPARLRHEHYGAGEAEVDWSARQADLEEQMERARAAAGRYEWLRPLPCKGHSWSSVPSCAFCERAFKATAEFDHALGRPLEAQAAALQEGRWYKATEHDSVAALAAATRSRWLSELR